MKSLRASRHTYDSGCWQNRTSINAGSSAAGILVLGIIASLTASSLFPTTCSSKYVRELRQQVSVVLYKLTSLFFVLTPDCSFSLLNWERKELEESGRTFKIPMSADDPRVCNLITSIIFLEACIHRYLV
jgi:hypothetical protein